MSAQARYWTAVALAFAFGYYTRSLRPWARFGDWLERQVDLYKDGPTWRQLYLVPLLWARFPGSLPYTIKWWCGWRPPPPPPRRTVPTSEFFGGREGDRG